MGIVVSRRGLALLAALVLLAGCASPPVPPAPAPPDPPAPARSSTPAAPPAASAAAPSPIALPTLVYAPTRSEQLRFASLSFPGTLWEPLLPPIEAGQPITVSGLLSIPRAAAPVPGLVLAHGCGGVNAAQLGWARRLNDLGIATLVVQSFAERGIRELCSGRETLNIASVLVDAYRARDQLAARPEIDASRIAIMGFSFGGRTALWTGQTRIRDLYSSGTDFAAHLAFYPTGCYMQLAGETQTTGRPIRIFHGAADDWTPIDQCAAYVERLQGAGVDATMIAYPDALHGFDDDYTGVYFDPGALSPRNCSFLEQDGLIVDAATGQEASTSSACVARGVTVGYNRAAHAQAIHDVEAFLSALFQQPAATP